MESYPGVRILLDIQYMLLGFLSVYLFMYNPKQFAAVVSNRSFPYFIIALKGAPKIFGARRVKTWLQTKHLNAIWVESTLQWHLSHNCACFVSDHLLETCSPAPFVTVSCQLCG